ISKVTPELNQLADTVTEQIRALDAFLAKANLGVSVLDTERDPISRGRERNTSGMMVNAFYYVGYGRDDDGSFGLVVIADAVITDKKGKPVVVDDEINVYVGTQYQTVWVRSLQKVSRELRIAALQAIPELMEALSKKAESTVKELRGSVEKTQEIVEELKAAI